jgi:hypothetical protein
VHPIMYVQGGISVLQAFHVDCELVIIGISLDKRKMFRKFYFLLTIGRQVATLPFWTFRSCCLSFQTHNIRSVVICKDAITRSLCRISSWHQSRPSQLWIKSKSGRNEPIDFESRLNDISINSDIPDTYGYASHYTNEISVKITVYVFIQFIYV